jgi:ABC-2 type transport system permease protein
MFNMVFADILTFITPGALQDLWAGQAGVQITPGLLLLFALLLALKGQNLFGLLLTTPGLYLAPLQLVSLLPIYVLWALPTVGWLLMVSSWARGKVFLWAVGTPLLLGALLKWASMITGVNLNAEWYMQNIVMRGLGSLLPTWLADGRVPHHTLINEGAHTIDMGNVVLHSYLTLTHVEMWIGAAAGAAMIYAAIRLRRWKDEG